MVTVIALVLLIFPTIVFVSKFLDLDEAASGRMVIA